MNACCYVVVDGGELLPVVVSLVGIEGLCRHVDLHGTEGTAVEGILIGTGRGESQEGDVRQTGTALEGILVDPSEGGRENDGSNRMVLEGVLVDHGYDCSAGVQNIASDGESLYINFYTPEEDYPCFFVFDKDFKVLQSHVFGWRHGVDLVGGGEPGAVRLIYGFTVNCWSQASKQKLDPAPAQNLFKYAELKDGKIHDITRYISFRKEKKR